MYKWNIFLKRLHHYAKTTNEFNKTPINLKGELPALYIKCVQISWNKDFNFSILQTFTSLLEFSSVFVQSVFIVPTTLIHNRKFKTFKNNLRAFWTTRNKNIFSNVLHSAAEFPFKY